MAAAAIPMAAVTGSASIWVSPRTVVGLSSIEIVDVEEMVVMFLHVLAHDVKNSNLFGALDEMYIKVNVPATDRLTFSIRGKLRLMYLASTTRKGILFTSSPVGKDPKQTVDSPGCPCTIKQTTSAKGGQRYHLQEWRGVGNVSTTVKEYFNIKHSSVKNVIERTFGVLKGCWAILRGNSYYPSKCSIAPS
ncbi:retrotransposon protein [Cucumis melo var. makuwa]|uniref:Retrotransposon protein n=1 Tax=Cucumis melo var. makuwa TaxID=1194695 RepID=A0A5A7VK05_CUCMM|nr:retrotransposon protein [Cucumis melo var. makuwa]TYK21088.1 retrotransposon protein [Cucumis melo var. makuwa]